MAKAHGEMDSTKAKEGYKGFGSFHSENVEDMIQDEAWVPPSSPIQVNDLVAGDCTFGRDMYDRHFLLDPEFTFLNHGAFGSPLRVAFEAAQRWRVHAERNPLKFIDRELFPQIVGVIKQFATFVACRPRDLAFVPNATTALNAVLESIGFTKGEPIYFLDCTYASLKKMIRRTCTRTGAVPYEVSLPLPVSDPQQIVDKVKDTLPEGCKFAVFDHVTSNEAMLLPIRDLIDLCHARGIRVLIDGAHGLMSTALDLTECAPEYYVGNCHKWFCSPKGVGFLYVNHARLASIAPTDSARAPAPQTEVVCSDKACERVRNTRAVPWGEVRPLVLSHGYGEGFTSEFIWDGARDYCALLSVPQCLQFWRAVGVGAALQYATGLLRWAVAMLTARWSTGTLLPEALTACMTLVGVPASVHPEGRKATADDAKVLQDRLHLSGVEVPVKVINGQLYVRISCWVYNEKKDYEDLAKVMEALSLGAAGGEIGQ